MKILPHNKTCINSNMKKGLLVSQTLRQWNDYSLIATEVKIAEQYEELHKKFLCKEEYL